jgi:glycosyltransferase involved in cell wall biosynthesis
MKRNGKRINQTETKAKIQEINAIHRSELKKYKIENWLPQRRLRIAQIAPLFESVPPRLYGGTERVVSYLTEALHAMGHEVTLYASGDSKTNARLVPMCERALRLEGRNASWVPYGMVMVEKAFADAANYDVMHFHIDYLHYPQARLSPVPVLTTLHGRLDIPEVRHMCSGFTDLAMTSISKNQRTPLPEVNWIGTVHHGLPPDLHAFSPRGGGYLAFLGRISPEKGVHDAIEIALRSGMPLKIAAKVDDNDRTYYQEVIRPLLSNPLVECIGEVGEGQKSGFLGGARALLMPIDWPEPFGLVMIEALACGTPVIAFERGAVPEVIEHGRTGFIVKDVEEGVEAVRNLGLLSRERCRAAFEKRFTAERMAEDYLKIYSLMIGIRTEKRGGQQLSWNVSSGSATSITS